MTEPVIASFFDHERQREDIYDFTSLGLDIEIAQGLSCAFEQITGHYRRSSRRQAWRSIRKFATFLTSQRGQLQLREKHPLILASFGDYLTNDSLMRKTAGSHFNFIHTLLEALKNSEAKSVWDSQVLQHRYFTREEASPRANEIDDAALRKIVSSSKREITEARKMFDVRRMIEQGASASHPRLSRKDVDALAKLIDEENRNRAVWISKSAAALTGHRRLSLRRIAPFRELTIGAALPFYLLMLVISAGNPLAIADIDIGCVEPHPTDPASDMLSWQKPRAGIEQSRPIIATGRYSIRKLVETIKQMTAPIRPLAALGDEKILFLNRKGARATRISVQSWHNALDDFRRRNALPYFTFSDIRATVAGIVKKRHVSSQRVSKVLGHLGAATSRHYLKGSSVIEDSYARIAKFQGEFVEQAKSHQAASRTDGESSISMLGFDCINPYAGLAEGSTKGAQCLAFAACATCPNAVVIIDDPRFIARIIKARTALARDKIKSAQDKGCAERFVAVYEPIVKIIDDDILSRVPRVTLHIASELAAKLPDLPTLD